MIANRITAWKNLMEATRPSGLFTVNPKELLIDKRFDEHLKKKKKQKPRKVKKFETSPNVRYFEDCICFIVASVSFFKIYVNLEPHNYTSEDLGESNWVALQNLVNPKVAIKHEVGQVQANGFFCGVPGKLISKYSVMIILNVFVI